jgi:hypothetical protein
MCGLSQGNIDALMALFAAFVVFGVLPFCWVGTNIFYEYCKKRIGFY